MKRDVIYFCIYKEDETSTNTRSSFISKFILIETICSITVITLSLSFQSKTSGVQEIYQNGERGSFNMESQIYHAFNGRNPRPCLFEFIGLACSLMIILLIMCSAILSFFGNNENNTGLRAIDVFFVTLTINVSSTCLVFFQQCLDEYPKVFIVGADNVGSRQMQKIRLSLRGHAGNERHCSAHGMTNPPFSASSSARDGQKHHDA